MTLRRGRALDPGLFDPERERELLEVMVERGPLVDGVTGQTTVSVDGLAFDGLLANELVRARCPGERDRRGRRRNRFLLHLAPRPPTLRLLRT